MHQFIIPIVILIFWLLINILIINIYKQNKIMKYSFLIFFVFAFAAIIFYDTDVINQLLYYLIRYFYYPSYDAFIFTVLLMIIVVVLSLFNYRLSSKMRVINCAFGIIILVSYIIFLILGIDVLEYKELYSKNSLICLRLVSRSFMIWLSIIGFTKYYDYFFRKESYK